MSHDEERVNGSRGRNKRDRAPRHWLNPLVPDSIDAPRARLRSTRIPTPSARALRSMLSFFVRRRLSLWNKFHGNATANRESLLRLNCPTGMLRPRELPSRSCPRREGEILQPSILMKPRCEKDATTP